MMVKEQGVKASYRARCMTVKFAGDMQISPSRSLHYI